MLEKYESETKTLEYATNIASIDFSNIDETIDLDSKEFSAVPTVPEGHLEEKAKSTTENVSQTTQYTAETVSSTLVNLKSKITPETTKKIVENQKPDGSIKLDKTVSDQINISSDNIQSSVQTYGVGDKISPKERMGNSLVTPLLNHYLSISRST
ncbi:unnamed protein product [Rhizophagus irregularis]|uniref:Uncharacterized protein n=1 Tax=Rhizophagus irregularis TaxID=588596 RepID=A0A915ZYH8_9GLOM|nr:unnamed protein product [Rhizophagus irregularis]